MPQTLPIDEHHALELVDCTKAHKLPRETAAAYQSSYRFHVPRPQQHVRGPLQLRRQMPQALSTDKHDALWATACSAVQRQLTPRRAALSQWPKVGRPCSSKPMITAVQAHGC